MPRSSKNTGWIDWASSESKLIIVKDLEDGNLSLDENEVSAERAWTTRYSKHPQLVLERVCFSQFKDRLKDHRKQVTRRAQKVSLEVAALAHDRLLYPRETHNNRGEPVFSSSAAQRLLRQDVNDKKHDGMTPLSFQHTRPEYIHFNPKIFKGRIYQEVRRQKFINHLEQDQAQKDSKRKDKAKKSTKKREAKVAQGVPSSS